MKSNVCKIEKGTKDLEAILGECERVAEYNGLNQKQAMHLRLLCEEIDGMLPNIIDDFDGELWLDFEDGVCKINVSIQIPEFNLSKKEELIAVAKNKKNSAAVGIVGKIRNAIENFLLDEVKMDALAMSSVGLGLGHSVYVDRPYIWKLDEYRSSVNEDGSEAWDELEKSVIASVADDVIVGVKGKKANITIVKSFA